jgi:hypothetical protein
MPDKNSSVEQNDQLEEAIAAAGGRMNGYTPLGGHAEVVVWHPKPSEELRKTLEDAGRSVYPGTVAVSFSDYSPECVDVAMAADSMKSVREHFVDMIARAVEERAGHADYTVDDVARAAGISRARVYQLLRERDSV